MTKWIILLLAPLTLLTCNLPSAQADELYFGASAATVGYNDGDNLPYKINAGYAFNRHFSLEVNYLDLGEKDYYDNSGDLSGTGYSAELVAQYPVGDFSVYAKLGNMWWQEKGKVDAHFGDNVSPALVNANGSDIIYGLGVDYRVFEHVQIKVEYQESKINDRTANPLSVGFNIRF